MTKFLLIRHATTNSVGKRLSGRLPGISLNEEGRQQAKKLAARLSNQHISAIYSSPLERATETAAPLATALNLNCITDNDFLEMDFGNWTNLTFKELETDIQFKRFNTFRSVTRVPAGETMAQAQLRIINGLEKLCAKHQGETVAVISHADLIRSAVAYYAGIHLDMFQRIEISPASVSIIEIYEDTALVKVLNDTGELSV